MKLNDIVLLFANNDQKKDKVQNILKKIADSAGIKDWWAFNPSKASAKYYAQNLEKELILYGDNANRDNYRNSGRGHYGWGASEIEHCIESDFSSEIIKKIDIIKEKFSGVIVNSSTLTPI